MKSAQPWGLLRGDGLAWGWGRGGRRYQDPPVEIIPRCYFKASPSFLQVPSGLTQNAPVFPSSFWAACPESSWLDFTGLLGIEKVGSVLLCAWEYALWRYFALSCQIFSHGTKTLSSQAASVCWVNCFLLTIFPDSCKSHFIPPNCVMQMREGAFAGNASSDLFFSDNRTLLSPPSCRPPLWLRLSPMCLVWQAVPSTRLLQSHQAVPHHRHDSTTGLFPGSVNHCCVNPWNHAFLTVDSERPGVLASRVLLNYFPHSSLKSVLGTIPGDSLGWSELDVQLPQGRRWDSVSFPAIESGLGKGLWLTVISSTSKRSLHPDPPQCMAGAEWGCGRARGCSVPHKSVF